MSAVQTRRTDHVILGAQSHDGAVQPEAGRPRLVATNDFLAGFNLLCQPAQKLLARELLRPFGTSAVGLPTDHEESRMHVESYFEEVTNKTLGLLVG